MTMKAYDMCAYCGEPCSDPTTVTTTVSGRLCGPGCFGYMHKAIDEARRHSAGRISTKREDSAFFRAFKVGVDQAYANIYRELDIDMTTRMLEIARGGTVHGTAPGRVPQVADTTIDVPKTERCGCGMHDIDPAGDRYAQHRRDWAAVSSEPKTTAIAHVRGIGISTPAPEPPTVDDATGDDVARDAYRTTGGRTLDSIIDEHRALTGRELLAMPAEEAAAHIPRPALSPFMRGVRDAMNEAKVGRLARSKDKGHQ